MKRMMITVLLLSTLASASHLHDLMRRYKHTPESQRYRIMNQIKLEVARLNKKRQHDAIRHLRSLNSQVQKRTKHRKKPRDHHRNFHHPSAQGILNGASPSGNWHSPTGGSKGSASGKAGTGGVSGSVSGPGGSSASGSVSGHGVSGSVSGPGGSGASGSFGPGGASGGVSVPGGGGVSGSMGGF